MKTLSASLFVSAIGLAVVFASPAEAAKKAGKHKKPAAAHSMKHRQTTSGVAAGAGFQGGVLAGPIYNGQDYIGTDPDPNIRAYLMKDLTGHYGGAI